MADLDAHDWWAEVDWSEVPAEEWPAADYDWLMKWLEGDDSES